MLRYSSGLTVTRTTPRQPQSSRKANICRLRLTLPREESWPPWEGTDTAEKTPKESVTQPNLLAWRRRTREESYEYCSEIHTVMFKRGSSQQLYQTPGGLSAGDLKHGVVYGVVHRSDDNHNKEMVVYGWSAHQLKEEMRYIRDVRLTLERVRNKMYGEYDEMKRKIQQLSSELAVSHAEQASLENHIQVHAAALESFREMSSSLTSASIELQKTLVDVTLENTVIRDQIQNLKQTHEQSMEKLKEKQKQLETAKVENELLRLKVESSQEANAEVMREMTRKLYSQYEEKLQEEEQKHKLEKETLLLETNRLLTAIEDANKEMRVTETSLQEKDQRIGELDRLIQRMEDERHQLQEQLIEYEMQLQGAGVYDQSSQPRSLKLEEITDSLRERIRHLDDMVLCQQKKVKHMVEEHLTDIKLEGPEEKTLQVGSFSLASGDLVCKEEIALQKRKLKEKEIFILQLLEKISFLEGENKELQDRLDYLKETQSRPMVDTRDIGVGCDLPSSPENRSRLPPEELKPARTYRPFLRVLEYSSKHRVLGPAAPCE